MSTTTVMLTRLSSLPSTALVTRTSVPTVRAIPSFVRFNSSEATAPQQTEESTPPKKRAIPLAQSLGNVSVVTGKRWGRPWQSQGQNRNRGPQRVPQEGGIEAQEQQQQYRNPRSLRPNNGPRRDGQAHAGSRPRPDQPRKDQQGRPPLRKWDQGGAASAEPQERKVEKPSSAPSSSKLQPTVVLGDLKDLFGPPTTHALPVAASAKSVTPSQARVQLLLENAAGDYSRYTPKTYATTDVKKLGPLKLAEFTLSRHRGVPPKRRGDALLVVEKFIGKSAPQVSA